MFEKVAEQFNRQDWHRMSDGDADLWRRFLTGQIPRLYGMFVKRWANPALAEDLVQKTVCDAVRGRAGYDPAKGSPEEWIFGIARNNIRLEIRKRSARPTVDGDITGYLEAIDTTPLPDEILERQETAAIVQAALNALPAKEQAVLRTKYIEALPAKRIALKMNMTEKAVHSLLYRARISLRGALKQLAPAEIKEE